MTDEIEHFSNLIYIQASCPQKPLSKHNNRGLADEHKTAFVCFICKGTNMTIIPERFENINQTGLVKPYNIKHCSVIETDVVYSIQCVCQMPILHSLLSTHTHKLKWIQLLTTCQTHQCIEKTCDLWPTANPILHSFAFFQNVWMSICFATKHSYLAQL